MTSRVRTLPPVTALVPRPSRVAYGSFVIAITLLSVLAITAGSVGAQSQPPPTTQQEAFVLGLPEGTPLSGPLLDQRTEEVAGDIRCPVCQGLAVADSFSDTAVAMKAEVKQMLAEGYSDEQVFAYFEASYGEFIRLKPTTEGFNMVVWIAPVVVLLIGFSLVVLRLRSAHRASLRDAEDAPEALPGQAEDDDLADYLDRVRKDLKPTKLEHGR